MGNETQSIVADALAAIAQAAPGTTVASCDAGDQWDANADTLVFSYRRDFAALWGIGNSAGKSGGLNAVASGLAGRVLTLVVVWDGIPAGNTGPVATAGYLTPIDWAVALSLTVQHSVSVGKRNVSSADYPSLRILVLDIASQSITNSSSDLFVRQFPKRDVMSMPWIRLFSPVVDGDNGWGAEKLIDNLASTVSRNYVPTMREVFGNAKPDLDAVRRLWSTFLTKPIEADDHHAIANLIGPMLLMGDTSQDDSNMQALRCLMEAIGLVPRKFRDGMEEDDVGTGRAILREGHAWYVKDSREKKLKLLVLDDQWRQGWGEVICRAVGVPYQSVAGDGSGLVSLGLNASGIEVKAAESAEWLIQKLEENGANDRRFKLSLDDDADAEELLFLDLRLFSGKPIKDEANFIERLAHIAERFPAGGKSPWPGFTADELSRVREWTTLANENGATNELRNDPRYHVALTILARIISLVDLSYPVVLFSSTGKKRIVEPLRGYGNVITIFGKPEILVLNHNDYIEVARDQFSAAMKSARLILNARKRCRDFVDTTNPYHKAISKPLGSSKFYHVEFYVDETNPHESALKDLGPIRRDTTQRDTGWRVGGCFAVFEGNSSEEAMANADRFEDNLVQEGVRYFVLDSNGPQPLKVIEEKGHSCQPFLSKAIKTNPPVCLGIASLYQETNAIRPSDVNFFDVHHDDQLYLSTLNALVEAFLFESLPAIFGTRAESVSLSLFAANRINAINADRAGCDVTTAAMKDDFSSGISWEPRGAAKVIQSTFLESEFAPIVRSVCKNREVRRIFRALAVQLWYQNEVKRTPDRFVCRQCKVSFRTTKMNAVTPQKGMKCRGRVESVDKNSNSIVRLSPNYKGIVFGKALTIGKEIDVEVISMPKESWHKYPLKMISEAGSQFPYLQVERCPVCKLPDHVRPDSRALHYVADQILTSMFGNGCRSYCPSFGKLVPGEFEDSLDNFPAVLSASRALDDCDPVRAVIDFPLGATRKILIKDKDEKNHKPAIRDYVRYRIGASLASISGDTFTTIVDRLT